METTTKKPAQNKIKYAFSKKPVYYFHADEDFREDWDWGKEKTQERASISTTLRQVANRAIV
jgi:hypothetical protein